MMPMVVRIEDDRADEVIAALSDAFHEYPVMRFVLKDAGGDYAGQLEQLVGYFTHARLTRGWPVLAVEQDGQLVAAANINPPESLPAPAVLESCYRQMCSRLSTAAVARFHAFAAACEPLEPDEPHYYLGMLGVRRRCQGQGHARRLLDRLHAMSAEHPQSRGVVLTTETEENLPLYGHFGYRILGEATVKDVEELRTWTLFRPDPI